MMAELREAIFHLLEHARTCFVFGGSNAQIYLTEIERFVAIDVIASEIVLCPAEQVPGSCNSLRIRSTSGVVLCPWSVVESVFIAVRNQIVHHIRGDRGCHFFRRSVS